MLDALRAAPGTWVICYWRYRSGRKVYCVLSGAAGEAELEVRHARYVAADLHAFREPFQRGRNWLVRPPRDGALAEGLGDLIMDVADAAGVLTHRASATSRGSFKP
ncbi:MAG TPA: hypothetical protein VLH79_04365 [Chthonomonadales bacterium]|nr:hypothetical protein [Chthonomonadales bacterium]